jgi:hypothetical protein
MTFVRALRPDEITIDLFAEQENHPPESSLDEQSAKWAKDQLVWGNRWGWCTAVVRAKWHEFEGVAYLGCCSYGSEEDFIANSGYHDDMMVEAMIALQDVVEKAARELEPLVTRESVDEWLVGEVQNQ